MMGWVGSGEDFCGLGWVGLGWVQKFWIGLGFEKVTHDQLCAGVPIFRVQGTTDRQDIISSI